MLSWVKWLDDVEDPSLLSLWVSRWCALWFRKYQGHLLDYLGIDFVELPDGRIHLSYPHLID